MKRNYFLLWLLLAAIGSGYGQDTPPRPRCFADELLKQAIDKDPEVKNRMMDYDRQIIEYKKRAKPKSNTDPLLIPVIVYVVHAGGTGNITDAQVTSQMDALNDHFAAADIQFCVATLRNGSSISGPFGSVQTTPGIIHVNNAVLATHNIESEQDDLENMTLFNEAENYLRIWVVNQILENGQPSNIAGYSVLPEFVNGFDGIVIENSVFGSVDYCPGCTLLPGYDTGKALAHEAGHYLGLQHTYFEECVELTEGDCETRGDRVCDTPPAVMDFSCAAGLDSCNEPNNEPDDISNFMAYGADACLNHFTVGQIEKMHGTIELYRHELVDSDNLIYTGSCGFSSTLSATFTASNYYICDGGSVSFDPLVNGATYSWNFGDPASGIANTSALENPTHTFASAAGSPYTVTLTISDGITSLIEQLQVYVEDCAPISSPIGQWYFGTENGLDFSSGVPVYDNNANINNTAYGEACAVQNENDGDFLFATNGIQVWDNSFTQINGTDLLGNISSHGGALIVPVPGSTTQYRIFTKDAESGPNGFRSSIVNIVNGNEAVMGAPATVNQAITIPAGLNYQTGNNGAIIGAEGIAAIEHCNGYWILTGNKKVSGYFITVYNLTNTGLAYDSQFELPVACTATHAIIKSSPNGNLIAYVGQGVGANNGRAYLLQFDKFSGTISNLLDLDLTTGYGASFSPDSQVFYIGVGSGCFQFDALSSNPAATRKFIEYPTPTQTGDFQLGPDGKIYITGGSSKPSLSVIHNPDVFNNNSQNDCQFSFNGPVVQQDLLFSLPNNIDCTLETAYTNTVSAYPQGCLTYSFAANVCGTTYSWNFGDPASSGANTSNLSSPVHTFSAAGTYTVTVNVSGTAVGMQITVGGAEPTIAGLTTACSSGANQTSHSVILQPDEDVVWSIISGSGSLSVSTQPSVNVSWTSLPGTLRATVTDDNGCVHIVEQEITEYCDGDYCAENIEFNTPQPVATESYSVSNSIITENNYQVPVGADIELLAENLIHIQPNAWIKNGAFFLADIQECVPPPPSLNFDEVSNLRLIVYPNPTTGLVTLSGIPMYGLTLHDILGKGILSRDANGEKEFVIDISQLQQGIYFLKVTSTDSSTQTIKIIKE